VPRVSKPRTVRTEGTADALVVCTGQHQFELGYKLHGKVVTALRRSNVITHDARPGLD
jgi:hypothetical protein